MSGNDLRVHPALVLLTLVIVLAAVVLPASVYQLDQAEQAVILQFGKPVGKPVTTPGLKFKVPFIQEVRRFDKRIQQWDAVPTEITTSEQEFIQLETTARWRIVDPLTFLTSVRDMDGALQRLDDIINDSVGVNVAHNMLHEIVRSKDSTLETDVPEPLADIEALNDVQKEFAEVKIGRERITRTILDNARASIGEYGIELIDIRIRRLNYVPSVRQKIYEEMISERERIAGAFRAQGKGESDEIRGDMQKEVDIILSGAKRSAEEIQGEAEGRAAAVYNEAYTKDEEFFTFFRTMESYRQSIGPQSTLMLDSSSDYFKYLREVVPAPAGDQP